MTFIFDVTYKNRAIFTKFLDGLTLEQLNTVPTGFNNSIWWNIAHTLVTQQLLVYKLSGLESVLPDAFIEKYRKGTKTEENGTTEELAFVKEHLVSIIKKTEEDFNNGVFKAYNEYTVSTGSTLTSAVDAISFNNFHEGIHLGYILAQKKALGL